MLHFVKPEYNYSNTRYGIYSTIGQLFIALISSIALVVLTACYGSFNAACMAQHAAMVTLMGSASVGFCLFCISLAKQKVQQILDLAERKARRIFDTEILEERLERPVGIESFDTVLTVPRLAHPSISVFPDAVMGIIAEYNGGMRVGLFIMYAFRLNTATATSIRQAWRIQFQEFLYDQSTDMGNECPIISDQEFLAELRFLSSYVDRRFNPLDMTTMIEDRDTIFWDAACRRVFDIKNRRGFRKTFNVVDYFIFSEAWTWVQYSSREKISLHENVRDEDPT